MVKRAAIYVRTSSERQGEKVSPREQESACRKLASERGYEIVGIYRDIERYRVRGKLIQPSGSRADRPGLRQVIADGQAGLFEILIAWKEDRLYRGFRAMLDVLDLVEQYDVDIELVTEHFDRKIAPVKAWAAKMELEGITERMMMGRVARLKEGKTLGNIKILGYDIEDGVPVVNPEEAKTVRFIFEQVAYGDAEYPDGVPIRELRKRLIAGGHKQKTNRYKSPWTSGVIYNILSKRTYLGELTYNIGNETYTIHMEPIISQETFDKAQGNIAEHKQYPVRNARELGFLLVGKLYCPNGHRMNYRVQRYWYKTLASGKRKRYTLKRPLAYGTCGVAYSDGPCDYRRVASLQKVEQAVLDEIVPLLLDSGNLLEVARELVEHWQTNHINYEAEAERLRSRLGELKEERLWVVTQGRKGILTDEDMAQQLAMLTQEERSIRERLQEVERASTAGKDLLAMAAQVQTSVVDYEDDLRALATKPIVEMSVSERREVQRWFDAVVTRVDFLGKGDDLRVETDVFGALRVMSNTSTRTRPR